MPIEQTTDYRPNLFFRSGHLNTIYTALYRIVEGVDYQRERLTLPDDDFVDLDWSRKGSQKLLIVLHGLEGSADRPYVRGMIRIMNEAGWDGVGFNFRGCSGEPNIRARNYHSGETGDLDFLIQKLEQEGHYKEIAIIGFSLGGNVTLKYLGEKSSDLSPLIKAGIGISTPVHLASCSNELKKPINYFYMQQFMVSLKEKIKAKERLLETKHALSKLNLDKIYASRNFHEFDEYATAPLHGFDGAEAYWAACSSLQFLPNITVPVLLVNAQNDSFLSEESYPVDLAKGHRLLHLEMPKWGGHVGFLAGFGKENSWTENRVLRFLGENV